MNIEGPSVVPTDPHIVELDRLGDEIAELAAHLDAATARLLDLIREFDARGGWGHGFRSCAHWLSWRVGLEPGAAREHVRVARALGSLPQLREALARVATPETEERLVAVGRAGTAERVELIVRGWRRMDRKAEAQETTRRHRNRALHVYPDGDGMVLIRGRLEPEVGAVVMQALTAAREALSRRRRAEDVPAGTSVVDGSAEAPTMEQQQADALALVAEAALHRGMDSGAPDADAPGQSVLDGGARVPAGTSRRLACDASRVVMRHDADGRITEVGARTRTIPPALRRALQHRDKGCRFPGCGRLLGQGHHIRHWAHGGPTTLSNLTMLCRRHHRAVHEEGFQVERLADDELCFRGPDGRLLSDVPPPAAMPANPVDSLRAQNDAGGLHIDARTSTPGWQGERLDVGYAISVLHPLAVASR